MKTFAFTVFSLVSSLALAQRHTSISRSINDDGKTLSIRVNGTIDGKPVDYDRTFDVARLNRDERNALRERILDSLAVSLPEPPKPPVAPNAPQTPGLSIAPDAPTPPTPPTPPVHPNESITIHSSDDSVVSVTGGDSQVVAVGGKQPYTKEVKYDSQSGQLYLRYRFKKDGDEVTYERTIDARNKSQQERQRMIDAIEKGIGVPATGK